MRIVNVTTGPYYQAVVKNDVKFLLPDIFPTSSYEGIDYNVKLDAQKIEFGTGVCLISITDFITFMEDTTGNSEGKYTNDRIAYDPSLPIVVEVPATPVISAEERELKAYPIDALYVFETECSGCGAPYGASKTNRKSWLAETSCETDGYSGLNDWEIADNLKNAKFIKLVATRCFNCYEV